MHSGVYVVLLYVITFQTFISTRDGAHVHTWMHNTWMLNTDSTHAHTHTQTHMHAHLDR